MFTSTPSTGRACSLSTAPARNTIGRSGCRVVANDRGVRSIRYHFSNRSDDIRNLYCAALDRLGIPWTHNSRYQIAVYRKAATARLDRFVGPKT